MQRACTRPPRLSATTVILTSAMALSNSGFVQTERAGHRPVATQQAVVKAGTANASCWTNSERRPAWNGHAEGLLPPYMATTSRRSRRCTPEPSLLPRMG